jgi:hypothetical protein
MYYMFDQFSIISDALTHDDIAGCIIGNEEDEI